jgi:hypothetical protein
MAEAENREEAVTPWVVAAGRRRGGGGRSQIELLRVEAHGG